MAHHQPSLVCNAGEVAGGALKGPTTLEHWRHDSLPHGDHLVNMILVRDPAQAPNRDALWRALAPDGVLLKVDTDGGIVKAVKPRSPEMGDWTHPWHDADGSLSGNDRALMPPNAFQWIAGPSFPMANRKDSAGVILSDGEWRLYFGRP